MAVKPYLILAMALIGAQGCETAKRLAPPGFIKYEEIAGDQPVNPAIEARIDERREQKDASFPKLSETPNQRPEKAEDAALMRARAALTAAGGALSEAATADMSAAAAERASARAELEAERDALARQVARERRAAEAEKRQSPQ